MRRGRPRARLDLLALIRVAPRVRAMHVRIAYAHVVRAPSILDECSVCVWRVAECNECRSGQGDTFIIRVRTRETPLRAGLGRDAERSCRPAVLIASCSIDKRSMGNKSREEKDARAKGYNNGAFIGTIIAGPAGGVVGGMMGAAAEAKKERKDFENGGHVRHDDTAGAQAIRNAKALGGMWFRAGM